MARHGRPQIGLNFQRYAGPAHLLGNMLYLWIFGDNIEDAMGHGRLVAFFLPGLRGGGGAHPRAGRPRFDDAHDRRQRSHLGHAGGVNPVVSQGQGPDLGRRLVRLPGARVGGAGALVPDADSQPGRRRFSVFLFPPKECRSGTI